MNGSCAKHLSQEENIVVDHNFAAAICTQVLFSHISYLIIHILAITLAKGKRGIAKRGA